MHTMNGLLLVANTTAIALFVVLPLVGIALGAVAIWLVLKQVSKKKSAAKAVKKGSHFRVEGAGSQAKKRI